MLDGMIFLVQYFKYDDEVQCFENIYNLNNKRLMHRVYMDFVCGVVHARSQERRNVGK